MYIRFDKSTGNILQITNLQPEGDFLEVNFVDVEDIHLGKKSCNNYFISYNKSESKYELLKKNVENIFDKTINDILYCVPIQDKKANIHIIQDVKNECWKFLISSDLEINLRSNLTFLDYILYFSVTQFENPNILYKLLEVNLEQLVKNHYQIIPFSYNFEYSKELVSVYTNKRFEFSYERTVK